MEFCVFEVREAGLAEASDSWGEDANRDEKELAVGTHVGHDSPTLQGSIFR